MWAHATQLLGVPGAIKAALDLFDRFSKGALTPPEGTGNGKEQLRQIKEALSAFAVDAIELKAYKTLHAATNEFLIDLRETFTLAIPDEVRARQIHSHTLQVVKAELDSIWTANRGGNQLAALLEDPVLLKHLEIMPQSVMQFVPAGTWNDHFWRGLKRATSEAGNFDNFYVCICEVRHLNMALNAYADRQIKRGIEEFDRVMDQLRHNLAVA
jgi:hypothetical protein